MSAQQPIVAVEGDTVVGVAGAHAARTLPAERRRAGPDGADAGELRPAHGDRILSWIGEWSKHDPKEPHVHLGPVGVDRDRQGQGIGSLLMAEHCRRLDEAGTTGYLETDKDVNVPFYERFGYEVVETRRRDRRAQLVHGEARRGSDPRR